MRTDARTPEELEMLLEDTLIRGDRRALADLFEGCAVLAVDESPQPIRHGGPLDSLCPDGSYLAGPLFVVQAQDTALVVTARGANVARRGPDGSWRYTILHFRTEASRQRSEA
ncbi:MAG: hypothetical protein WD178_10190 [Actinomycetota bacterium]